MQRVVRFAVLSIFLASFLFLVSCSESEEESTTSSTSQQTKDYDLLIYNTNKDIGESLEEMCDNYTSRSGVIVKVITTAEEDDALEDLSSYMSSGEAPDIFTINSMAELKTWQASGNVLDFSNATETSFKEVANAIPEPLRLSSNTVDNFGMPYTVTGYGYVVDPKMISSLFGGDKYRAVLSDMKACSYEEFEDFVNALKAYIENGSIYEFYMNGNKYKFVEKKSGLSENLTAVFAFPAGVSSYTSSYLLNQPLAYKFNSAAEVNVATDEMISSLQDIFYSFARSLDLLTSSVTSRNGKISRGVDLVNNVTNSQTQALKNFINGQALFLIADNSIYDSMFLLDSSIATRVSLMPIKMPEPVGESMASNLDEDMYRQSIVISVPMYFAINAQSDESHQKLAQNFLVWFKTSELAQKYILQEFKFIPYDISESSAIDNQLSKKMIEYLSSKQYLPAAALGLPDGASDEIANSLIDKYYTLSSWSGDEYTLIAQEIINIWKRMK